MADAVGWLVVLLIVVLVFWSLSREGERKRRRSAEEFEREVVESRNSLMRAGMLDLDRFVGDISGKRAAVEYLKDEEQGQTKTGGKADDADRTEGEKEP
jgi:hypothetical protein